MPEQLIRIGIVGAGENTRRRHIPGLRELDDVEIVGVANSSAASSERAAKDLDISRAFPDWQSLIDDDEIDAVVIGTWPNLHAEVTCAALDAGKHVLCEARMARNVAEARQMVAAAERNSQLVTQIVPSPFGLECGPAVAKLVDEGYLGELREVVVIGADDAQWDYTAPVHWRQRREISGVNVLTLGILHETVSRWIPSTERVLAQTALFETQRPSPDEGRHVPVDVPDSVQVLSQIAGGARGLYHFSGAIMFGPGHHIHLYGSRGTIKVQFGDRERVLLGRIGDESLKEAEIPDELRGGWDVEREFVAAIRGERKVELTDFATALSYMEFTEAVHRSAENGTAVGLPLED